MLESLKISRRQSEIRQALAGLVGKEKPDDAEVRALTDMDAEYRANEVRFRASLIAEDAERREAGLDLETRDGNQWGKLVGGFQVRQAILHLAEGSAFSGATAEVVQEMRARGGFSGVPVPLEALSPSYLERRAGETLAASVADPMQTRPIVDRLFPQSVMARMGGQLINIDSGSTEWPVSTGTGTASWAGTETGLVTAASFATTEKSLQPNQNLGVQFRLTRRAMKQTGGGLEAAVRRDMNGAVQAALDKAAFQGAGSGGEPAGVIAGAAGYGINVGLVTAAASWGVLRDEVIEFMSANAADGPGAVNLLINPTTWGTLDGQYVDTGTGVTEWSRTVDNIPRENIVMSSNATGGSSAKALLTTAAGGLAPFFVGVWGGVDLIRDPFSDAQSGTLRLTALLTADVTVARASQLRVLASLVDP